MCIHLAWCAKVWIYLEKHQFKMLAVFPHFFVTDTKILFGYNFLAPLNYIMLMLKFKQTNQSCSFSKISQSINVEGMVYLW